MAQPMINVLNFDMSLADPTTGDPTSDGASSRYIDLAKELSKVNRKLYRQCRRYAVAGIQVIGSEGTSVSFFTAVDTWTTKNAIKKAFHAWQKMNKEALADQPSIKPTWHDFKVYLNKDHRGRNATDLQAVPDFDYAPYPSGEWAYSQVVFPEGTTHDSSNESYLHIQGNHINQAGADAAFNPQTTLSVGIIEAYKESRTTVPLEDPVTPAMPDVHPFNHLFDDGETYQEITQNLKQQNDQAPYAVTTMNGAAAHPSLYNAAEIRVQSSEVVNMTNGFVAPCGLIKVATNQVGGILRLKVFLVPADNAYGVATEAII